MLDREVSRNKGDVELFRAKLLILKEELTTLQQNKDIIEELAQSSVYDDETVNKLVSIEEDKIEKENFIAIQQSRLDQCKLLIKESQEERKLLKFAFERCKADKDGFEIIYNAVNVRNKNTTDFINANNNNNDNNYNNENDYISSKEARFDTTIASSLKTSDNNVTSSSANSCRFSRPLPPIPTTNYDSSASCRFSRPLPPIPTTNYIDI